LPGDPDRSGHLALISSILLNRFHTTESRADLDEAISFLRKAFAEAVPDDEHRWLYLANLGRALVARSRNFAVPDDADEGIAALQDAIRHFPTGHTARVDLLVGAHVIPPRGCDPLT
jgi:hypothetical protein